MKFVEFTEEQKAFPGEFLYHEPTNAIVKCGAFMGDKIKALNNGKLFEEAKKAFTRVVNDTIDENLTLDQFFRYLRRFYIVSGLAQDDKEVGSKMRNLFEMAMYLKINKEE